MALKIVKITSDTCVRCGGSAGPEVIPGDTVKMYLDQDANPDFPEWVEGTIISIEPETEASTGPKNYQVQYEVEDLDESASLIRDCDVISMICEGCCKIINDYLDQMAEINLPHVTLTHKWNADGTFTLTANAWSTQVAGQPGTPVLIDTYVFKDPADATIAQAGGDAVNTRLVTPTDTGEIPWPGGLYSVLVTDTEGLANSASVWVAPKPRYRHVTVTLLQNTTTVGVSLEAGEEIISVMATRSDGGFYQFAPTVGDHTVIEASAAPIDGDLDLQVLIHIP